MRLFVIAGLVSLLICNGLKAQESVEVVTTTVTRTVEQTTTTFGGQTLETNEVEISTDSKTSKAPALVADFENASNVTAYAAVTFESTDLQKLESGKWLLVAPPGKYLLVSDTGKVQAGKIESGISDFETAEAASRAAADALDDQPTRSALAAALRSLQLTGSLESQMRMTNRAVESTLEKVTGDSRYVRWMDWRSAVQAKFEELQPDENSYREFVGAVANGLVPPQSMSSVLQSATHVTQQWQRVCIGYDQNGQCVYELRPVQSK